MLEKSFYKTLLSHSFNIPVRVNYWDGKSDVYGAGDPEVTITFNEKIPVKAVAANAPWPWAKPTWTRRLKLTGASKSS